MDGDNIHLDSKWGKALNVYVYFCIITSVGRFAVCRPTAMKTEIELQSQIDSFACSSNQINKL